MSKSRPVPIALRIPAAVCRICPLCIVRRRRPDSVLAKLYAKIAGSYPFCIAYGKVMQIAAQGKSTQDQPAEADDGAGLA